MLYLLNIGNLERETILPLRVHVGGEGGGERVGEALLQLRID